MTRKTTAYTRRRAQGARIDPLAHARTINALQPFTEAEQTDLTLPVRLAFESLRLGQAKDNDFDTLAVIVNTCLVRSEQIGSSELIAHTKDAQESLMRIKERAQRTGQIGMDAKAQADLLPIIDLHEQLIELSTPKQMHAALVEVLDRMRRGNIFEIAR